MQRTTIYNACKLLNGSN